MKILPLSFPLACAIGLAACGDATAPDVNGPTYFTASVNGRTWSPTDTTASFIQASLVAQHTFIIHAWQALLPFPPTQSIDIANVSIAGPGTYFFGASANGPDAGFLGPLQPGDPVDQFLTDSVHTGQLRIQKLDTVDHVMIGSFSFVALRADGARMAVTQGKFRVHYIDFP
jgi:hypothetical protein